MNKYILVYSIEVDADNETIAEQRGKDLVVDKFSNLTLISKDVKNTKKEEKVFENEQPRRHR